MTEKAQVIPSQFSLRGKSFKVYAVCFLASFFIRLLRLTYRFEVVGLENRWEAEKEHPKGAFAIASWHEHCFGCILGHAFQEKICLLVSPSFDGDMTAHAAKKLGLFSVRGSSSRRGKTAKEEYLALSKEGYRIAITVDGPKGPRHSVKSGIVNIPKEAGMAILPTTSYARRNFVLSKSWDQMKLPKPFSKVYIAYGQKIVPSRDIEGEAFTQMKGQVKEALFDLDKKIAAYAREENT